jgi:hypothetical protein
MTWLTEAYEGLSQGTLVPLSDWRGELDTRPWEGWQQEQLWELSVEFPVTGWLSLN